MIKKVRSSLTAKICILVAMLLLAVSVITYGMISKFLPTYYKNQLEEDIDAISVEMAEKVSSYNEIEEAFYSLELFEAGSQVSVVILDEQGNPIYPLEIISTEEEVTITVEDNNGDYAGEIIMEYNEQGDEENGNVSYVVTYATESAALRKAEIGADIWSNIENSAVKYYDVEVGEKAYTMIVSGGMQPVNQAMEILHEIFPYILTVSALMAIFFSLAVSFYLTRPIVGLSRTSKKLAALDFHDRYEGKRTDEIGILGNNLNELSENLSVALGELQQANEKLKSDIEKEREIEKKRIEFFSAVSHELKTPITILKGHLSGMIAGVGEYKNKEYYLQRAQETSEKMEAMVGELLTVSRIESKKFVTQKTDIAEMIRQQLAEMTELVEEKHLELQVDMPEHLNAEVNLGMMEKVFRNVLMNAVRYTPAVENDRNEIRVELKSCESDTMENGFFCRVENTGTFIPEEALSHVFEAFYRVEQSRNRETGGSGLGLYIVKMVMEQHGGNYSIHNTAEGVEICLSCGNSTKNT